MKNKILLITLSVILLLSLNIVSAEINPINMTIPNATISNGSGIIENNPNLAFSRLLTEINMRLDKLSAKMDNVSDNTVKGTIDSSTLMLQDFKNQMKLEFQLLTIKIILGLAGAMLFSFAVYELIKIKFSYSKKIESSLLKEAYSQKTLIPTVLADTTKKVSKKKNRGKK